MVADQPGDRFGLGGIKPGAANRIQRVGVISVVKLNGVRPGIARDLEAICLKIAVEIG